MLSTRQYIDLAMQTQGITTQSELAALLGISQSVLSRFMRGKDYPSPDVMRRIAELAAVDVGQALLDWSIDRVDRNAKSMIYDYLRSGNRTLELDELYIMLNSGYPIDAAA